jgi:hypothetical protein
MIVLANPGSVHHFTADRPGPPRARAVGRADRSSQAARQTMNFMNFTSTAPPLQGRSQGRLLDILNFLNFFPAAGGGLDAGSGPR